MKKYSYTIQLSPVTASNILAFMEQTECKLITEHEITVESPLSPEDKRKELENKIGTKTPDGDWEFAGFSNLKMII